VEPLTHTLFGAAIGHVGRGRAIGEARARGLVAAGVIGANAPDIDVLAYVMGSDIALGFRRGVTHGVLAMAILPALLSAIFLWWRRRREVDADGPVSRRRLVAVLVLACWSHPLLDWLNNYGVRLLMPFDGRWFYGDLAFIADPWMWLIVGGAVALARAPAGRERWCWSALTAVCALLVAGAPAATGARVAWAALLVLTVVTVARWRGGPSPVPAAAGLALFGLYVGVLATTELRARDRVALELGVTLDRRELMVGPTPMDPTTWQVVARSGAGYRLGRYRAVAGSEGGIVWESELEPGPPGRPSTAAWSDRRVAGFALWVRFPYHRIVVKEGERFVYLLDARYTSEPTTGFGGVRLRAVPADPEEDREALLWPGPIAPTAPRESR
jgi:inner membrane protein